jgi:glycosyltransferase involved in cell wall biosynthesis
MRTSHRVKNAIEKASGIMCATQEDSDTVKRLFHKDNVILPEVGLTKMTESGKIFSQADDVLKLCWSGLHIPRKSLNLLLESIVGLDNVELHVLGDGPKRKEWMKLSNDLHLTNVVWHGNLPRENALLIMQGCDVFVQTSLSDATSTVLLEALSLGLPVVALNHLGFANVITDNCGMKIHVGNKHQIVCDLAKAIDRLNKDRCLLKRLSEGAIKRAEENSWESKSEILCKIYENTVAGGAK